MSREVCIHPSPSSFLLPSASKTWPRLRETNGSWLSPDLEETKDRGRASVTCHSIRCLTFSFFECVFSLFVFFWERERMRVEFSDSRIGLELLVKMVLLESFQICIQFIDTILCCKIRIFQIYLYIFLLVVPLNLSFPRYKLYKFDTSCSFRFFLPLTVSGRQRIKSESIQREEQEDQVAQTSTSVSYIFAFPFRSLRVKKTVRNDPRNYPIAYETPIHRFHQARESFSRRSCRGKRLNDFSVRGFLFPGI